MRGYNKRDRYICNLCKKKFRTSYNHKKHLREEHKVKADEIKP